MRFIYVFTTTYHYYTEGKMKRTALSMIIMIVIGLGNVGSATIIGIPPNTAGQTNITIDTVWDSVDISLTSRILIGNTSSIVNFTIVNSTISTKSYIHAGLAPAKTGHINIRINNSIIHFNVTSAPYFYTDSACNMKPCTWNFSTDQYLKLQTAEPNTGAQNLYIYNSTIKGNYGNHSSGLAIQSSGSLDWFNRSKVIIQDSNFQYIGGAYQGWTASTLGMGGAILANGSYFKNVSFDNTAYPINFFTNSRNNHVSFDGIKINNSFSGQWGGYDINNSYMKNATEGLYNPADGAWIRNGWYDANWTKFNIMSASNVTFENNIVYRASFNAGDGISKGNNTLIRNTFINTGVGSLINGTENHSLIVINNTFDGHSGGGAAIDAAGKSVIIDGNHFNYGMSPIRLRAYIWYWPFLGDHIVKNNIINSPGVAGIEIERAYNSTMTNNTIIGNASQAEQNAVGVWVKNSSDIVFIDTNISGYDIYQMYSIKVEGGYYYNNSLEYKFINTKFNENRVVVNSGAYFNNYYYLDKQVINPLGSPVSSIIVYITNLNDSDYKSINITGRNKTTFMTGIDGHTPSPIGNQSTSPALLAYWKNSTTRQNMSYLISVFDPNHLYTSTPTLIFPNGTLQQLSPLATATVSPNSSWYRPNPNTYQNTTVITINRIRTNITLKFPNGSIMVSNATQTSFEAVTDSPQSYVIINNTVPEFANKNLSFTADGVTYANSTADSKGFVSFNYTGAWSKHRFEWVIIPDGNVYLLDLIQVALHFGEATSAPYPNYDANEDGKVDISDVVLVAREIF